MTAPTTRLLGLLSLLQARRDWPGTVLAARLEVSPRTVRRDVERLREMGYRIHATMGPDGGYRLDNGDELPPLLFDDEQVVAVAVALRSATVTATGTEEAALRALTTVRQVMPSRLRHRLDALGFAVIPPGGAAPVAPDVLLAISAAVRAQEVLRLDYATADADDAGPPRRVEPHELVWSQGRWYLLAWDPGVDDWRIFRADRIRPRAPTGRRFTPRDIPGGDARAYLSARFKGSEREDAWPCVGTVVLQLPASAVIPFAGDGSVEDLGDGRTRYTSGSWSWPALAASLNRFDVEISEAHPPELRQAFGRLAERNAATAAG